MKQIENITPTQYHGLKFKLEALPNLAEAGPISASVLCKVKDPLTFLLGKEFKTTGAMDHGSLVDCLWTTPEHFENQYIVLPEDAPQRPTEAMLAAKNPSQSSIDRQRWWNDFERKCVGKEVVTASDHANAVGALRMLQQHPIASEMIESSLTQVALLGDSPWLAGTQAKCLFDLLPMEGRFSDSIIDLKTTNDPSDYAVLGIMHRFEYHLKMAYYRKLAEAAGFGKRPKAYFIWQRSSFPFDVHVRQVDEADLMIGEHLVMKRLEMMQRMKIGEITPYFDNEVSVLPMADWMRNSALM